MFASTSYTAIGAFTSLPTAQPTDLFSSLVVTNSHQSRGKQSVESDDMYLWYDTQPPTKAAVTASPNHQSSSSGQRQHSTLEIVMYALLGVCCLAIVIFIVNCIIFNGRKYKLKRLSSYLRIPSFVVSRRESASPVQDWIWVGRDELEKASINTRCSQTLIPEEDFENNNDNLGGGNFCHIAETSFTSVGDTSSYNSHMR